jgi:hypothetical protein
MSTGETKTTTATAEDKSNEINTRIAALSDVLKLLDTLDKSEDLLRARKIAVCEGAYKVGVSISTDGDNKTPPRWFVLRKPSRDARSFTADFNINVVPGGKVYMETKFPDDTLVAIVPALDDKRWKQDHVLSRETHREYAAQGRTALGTRVYYDFQFEDGNVWLTHAYFQPTLDEIVE